MTPEAIKRAYEARRHAVEELRALDSAANGRDFSAEETQTEQRLHDEINRLDKVVNDGLSALQAGADLDAAVAALEARSGAPAAEQADISFIDAEQRALDAFVRGEVKALDFMPLNVEQRAAMSKLAAGTGGNLVPVTMYDQIVKALRDLSSVMQGGATVVNTASGEDITVPQSNAFPSAAIVAEGSAIGKSDSTFNQKVLRAFKYAFISQASVELLADSAFNTAGYIAEVGAEALSHGIGTDFVVGAGSTNAPEGVCTAATTVGHTLAAAGVVTADQVIDWYHSLQRQYRANASFIVDDSLVVAIRKLKAEGNQYIWQPGLQAGQPDTLLGRPVLTDVAVPDFANTAGRILGAFGDFKRGYLVRIAGGVRVERSDEYAWDTDLVSWKFAVRADGRVVDPNAIRHLKNP
jgi:HK97 family phage major capsid protein